jgi:hypothetical protein
LSPWWRRRQVPLKRRFLQEPHGVTTQKTPFFIVTAVKTLYLTWTRVSESSSRWYNGTMDNKPVEVSIYADKCATLLSFNVHGSTRCALERELRGFRPFCSIRHVSPVTSLCFHSKVNFYKWKASSYVGTVALWNTNLSVSIITWPSLWVYYAGQSLVRMEASLHGPRSECIVLVNLWYVWKHHYMSITLNVQCWPCLVCMGAYVYQWNSFYRRANTDYVQESIQFWQDRCHALQTARVWAEFTENKSKINVILF